jgi:hypothetical protein
MADRAQGFLESSKAWNSAHPTLAAWRPLLQGLPIDKEWKASILFLSDKPNPL